ncbi:MAG: hypothetical protein NC123_07620 [Butyrivibrio sp.]|nr:hypothetical protein [Acetatifactor muris]MCM1559399.1 hypothetical protein [Butyrivibrio sp.]
MKEEKVFQLVAEYLKQYILVLTEGKEEAFLAINDIGPEMLQDADIPQVKGCCLVRVDQADYSEAVRCRNSEGLRKIVLLCSDSVRRIDSLKDFVECAIIPEDKELLWKLLANVFRLEDGVKIDLKEYVNTLIQYIPMEIKELIDYVGDCVQCDSEKGKISWEKLNDEVNRFGVWRTKGDYPKKGLLRRQIQYSRPDFVRRRLEKALEDEKLEDSLRKRLVSALAKDDIESLLKSVEYKDIEKYFRYKKPTEKNQKKEQEEEKVYRYSYDMYLKEEYEDIQAAEKEIQAAEKENSDDDNNAETESSEGSGYFEEAYNIFSASDEDLIEGRKQIERLCGLIDDYAILAGKKVKWKEWMTELLEEYNRSLERGDFQKITPVKLFQYCENQKKFISDYFRILGWLLADEAMNQVCNGSGLIEELQTLFCKVREGYVEMPFYHPAAGMYFLRLNRLYEAACRETGGLNILSDIPSYMVNQERLWFPIRFLQKKGKLYQLDYSCLETPGKITFYEKESRVSNSPVNFRLFNGIIEEYLRLNPYLGELVVCIVDLDDFRGISFLLGKLQKIMNANEYLISRITINIVSLKERELKRELSKLYDLGMEVENVYFRFIQGHYRKDSNELELSGLMENCDIIFFADTGVIYNARKMVRYTDNPNEVKRELEEFNVERQLDIFFQEKNYVELLWDTLQHIQNGGEVSLSKWSSQELNLRRVKEISDKVKEDPHFEAVIISANENLLRHIYWENNYCVKKSRASGNESVILTFSQQNSRQKLKEQGNGTIQISLSMVLDELSGEENICSRLLELENIQEIILQMSYAERRLCFQCIMVVKDADLTDEELGRCQMFAEETLKYAFADRGYLAGKFREILINELYGTVEDYTMALMLHQLSIYGAEDLEVTVEKGIQERKESSFYKNTDIMELLDMLEFFEEIKELDGSFVTRFREYYKKDMLSGVLRVTEETKLVDEQIRIKMEGLYESLCERIGE